MKMRRLLNLVPFMRESEEVAMVLTKGMVVVEGSPDYMPAKPPRTTGHPGHGKALYGLPCARCGVYYPAELAICPVCNSTERVLPRMKSTPWPASVPPRAVQMPPEDSLAGLALINRELLANPGQPMTL